LSAQVQDAEASAAEAASDFFLITKYTVQEIAAAITIAPTVDPTIIFFCLVSGMF
jgi:hypothetical protein